MAKRGGVFKARDVMHYHTPQGPTTFHHEAPGLGGHNEGHCGSQGPEPLERDDQFRDEKPGLHGSVHHCGSQGKHG